jgi:hypothetical protein
MSFFIKKVFDGKIDDSVKLKFMKFSRGKYEYRALVAAKNSKGTYRVGTTAEYANDLVRTVAEKLGDTKVDISGVVVSTQDLSGFLDFKDKKQFQGVKRYIVEMNISGKELIDLCDKFPKCFFGLSFKSEDTEIKIKPKAPKSGKPSSKEGEQPKADFCKIKTTDKNLVKDLLFDVDLNSFKEVYVSHTYDIVDIILPEGVEDPVELREKAKRKGKIIRELTVDESDKISEKEFLI